MVPVLSSIAQSKEDKAATSADAGGIQALFLYPLNALIQSQRERLRAWTGPFDGSIRFCLYNGNTPDKTKADEYRKAPNEVHDRSVLRDCPPDILVTNPTMLEYMLVRAQDAPILEKSQGKLFSTRPITTLAPRRPNWLCCCAGFCMPLIRRQTRCVLLPPQPRLAPLMQSDSSSCRSFCRAWQALPPTKLRW